MLRALAFWLLSLLAAAQPQAAVPAVGGVVTAAARYWVDAGGQTGIDAVAQLAPESFQPVAGAAPFDVGRGALWLRYELPALDAGRRWYLLVEGPAFINRATLHQRDSAGAWQAQHAGDRLAMSQWAQPDLTPRFALDPAGGGAAARTVWLRLENFPAALNPGLTLLDEQQVEQRRNATLLGMGAYLGFGLLVMFLGLVHVRLYTDRAFVPYMGYVGCMLAFQTAYTGLGALFFWPEWPRWNDAAPALFMLWLTASGIWFVREVSALHRLSRRLNRLALRWAQFGLVYPIVYLLFTGPATLAVLNLYGLLSVLLSVGLCVWAWRKGETYAGWMALGFAPLHLAYPFAALRTAGVLADGWITQYAVLIGSALEIPILLYILHRRAKDFNENRARMRALDSTDPLTGLPIVPVLLLRLGDALRRARRNRGHCGLALVELANHHELVAEEGRPLGDRALVVAASQLTSIVKDVDTVCRVADNRFAVLLESARRPELLQVFAPHIVAKGLAQTPALPAHLSLRYRVVTIALPDWTQDQPPAEELDVQRLIARANLAMDHLEPKRVILHLPLADAQQSQPLAA